MPLDRRRFLKQSAAVLALPAPIRALARTRANAEIRCAVVGIRSRGRQLINGLHELDGVRVVAVCDVDQEFLDREAKRFADRDEGLETARDVRRMLDRPDIDVIATATPNHWHALITIWACQAGKDVYVEKPVSHNVREGRLMIEAARHHGRIVQAGTQSRSSTSLDAALAWLREGHLGRVTIARGFCYKPRQSIGKVDGPQPIPPTVDYDLWLGPAPEAPLMRRSLHYDWHWDFATGNGDLGNQGIHQMDQCRWFLGESALPPRVISVGGRFGYDDDGNTPNTQIVYLDYPDAPLLFEVRGLPKSRSVWGENWWDHMDRYRGIGVGAIIECERGELRIPNYTSASAFDESGEEIKKWEGASSHVANFIEAVRSRRVEDLNADIAEGHVSSAMCHLGNISHHRGRPLAPGAVPELPAMMESEALRESYDRFRAHLDANEIDLDRDRPVAGAWLEFDPESERFTNDEQANALLGRESRAPFVVAEG